MEKGLLVVLIISGIAFVIQTVLGIIGIEDLDTPEDGGLFGFFTVRNLIAFCLGFSVTGYGLLRNGFSEAIVIIAGVATGVFMIFMVISGMRALSKLQQVNEITASSYRGILATVAIRIEPGKRGKVEFTINGRSDEMFAMSESADTIPKGSKVRVIKLINDTFLVEKEID